MSPVTLTSLAALGFLFGLRHAFDADHIAVISSLSADSNTSGDVIRRGIYWTAGHGMTLIVLGIATHLIGGSLPEGFSLFFEKIAAIILLVLGLHSIKNFLKSRSIAGAHVIHSHPPIGLHAHPHPSFFVGIIHGAAGSAGVLLIAVGAFKSIALSLIYIVVFSFGTLLGMLAVCALLGATIKLFRTYVSMLTGIFAVTIGITMLF